MNERIVWSYWFVTDLCLLAGLFWWPSALFLAMAVTVVHGIHCLIHQPEPGSFPMQVRFGYLGLLILGQVPGFRWINWVQLAGTTALVTVDYCPLARILSLMPWNRSAPFSWRMFVTAIFTPPVQGSIVQVVSPD